MVESMAFFKVKARAASCVVEGESGEGRAGQIRRCLSMATKPLRDEWDSDAVEESR